MYVLFRIDDGVDDGFWTKRPIGFFQSREDAELAMEMAKDIRRQWKDRCQDADNHVSYEIEFCRLNSVMIDI